MEELKQHLNEVYDISYDEASEKIPNIIRQKFGGMVFELFTDLQYLKIAEHGTQEQELYRTLLGLDIGDYSQNLVNVRGKGILSENQFEVIHQIGILSNTYWQLFENYERLIENQLVYELNVNYISQYLHKYGEEGLIGLTRDVYKMFNIVNKKWFYGSLEDIENHDNIE